MQDEGAEAAHGALFHRDQAFMLARQAQDHVGVQRLGEAGVGDGGRDAACGQQVGGFQRFLQTGAQRQDGDRGAFADDAALADLQRGGQFGDLDADAVAARIPERRRAVVDGQGGRDHGGQFRLVGGGHQHHAGQSPHEADVEAAGVGRAVGADQTGAVHGEAHRQGLDRHVVDDLVIAALKEGRIDGADRLHPVGGQTGGEGDGVLLGDADVEGAVGEGLTEQVQPRAGRHGGGDGHDAGVGPGVLDQLGAEDLGVAGGVGDGLGLLARDDVELDHAVILVGAVLSGGVALALLRHDVDQHRTVGDGGGVLQDGDQVLHVVTVDRPDVVEAQLLEEGAADDHAAGVFLGLARRVAEGARHVVDELLPDLADVLIGAARDLLGQIGAHAADGRGDRHVVVVQHHHQLAVGGLRGVVHRLIGHARRHGAVADDGHDAVLLALGVAGGGEAKRRRNRGRGVGRAEGVVFALGPLGEARQAAALTQGADAVATPGQDLVRIALMADVPDQDVLGRLEHMVQGHGQLDHAQRRAEVASGDGDGVDGLGPHVVGQLLQPRDIEPAHVGGNGDGVENGGVGHGDRGPLTQDVIQ
ncbi:hypothetical protein D3C72_978350 [compost metagenome]